MANLNEKKRTIDITRPFVEGGSYVEKRPVYSAEQRFGGERGEKGLAEMSGRALRLRESALEGYRSPELRALSDQMKRNIQARGAEQVRETRAQQGRYGVSGATGLRQVQDIRADVARQETEADQNLLLMQGEKQRQALEDFEKGVTGRQLGIQAEETLDRQLGLIQKGIDAKVYASQQSANAANAGGTCFITTACCELLGLPDDNNILNSFRKFRDEYLGGKENVSEYYIVAPKILHSMKQKDDLDYLYSIISMYLIPCYRLIKNEKYNETEILYRNMVNHLKDKYL